MTNINKTACISFLFFSFLDCANAFSSKCGDVNIEGEKADNMLSVLDESWEGVYSYYKKYSKYNCYSEGYYGEAIADSITERFAKHWDELDQLTRITKKDKKFEKFVLTGINATVAEEDLLKIHDLASKQCPNGFSKLCKRINNRSIKAHKEMLEDYSS